MTRAWPNCNALKCDLIEYELRTTGECPKSFFEPIRINAFRSILRYGNRIGKGKPVSCSFLSAPDRNVPGLDPIEMSPSGAGVGRSGGERKRTVAEPNPRAARSHTGRLLRLHGWFAAGL